MNESLVVLTNELRHTNEHMKSHGKRLGELERAPGARLREIASATVARSWVRILQRVKKRTLEIKKTSPPSGSLVV